MIFKYRDMECEINRIYIDRQGYTKSGQYYGTGAPIYSYAFKHPNHINDDLGRSGEFRTDNIHLAKHRVKDLIDLWIYE